MTQSGAHRQHQPIHVVCVRLFPPLGHGHVVSARCPLPGSTYLLPRSAGDTLSPRAPEPAGGVWPGAASRSDRPACWPGPGGTRLAFGGACGETEVGKWTPRAALSHVRRKEGPLCSEEGQEVGRSGRELPGSLGKRLRGRVPSSQLLFSGARAPCPCGPDPPAQICGSRVQGRCTRRRPGPGPQGGSPPASAGPARGPLPAPSPPAPGLSQPHFSSRPSLGRPAHNIPHAECQPRANKGPFLLRTNCERLQHQNLQQLSLEMLDISPQFLRYTWWAKCVISV